MAMCAAQGDRSGARDIRNILLSGYVLGSYRAIPLRRDHHGISVESWARRAGSTQEYGAAVEETIVETRAVLRTFTAMLRISEVEVGARRAGFATVDLAQSAADVAEFYEPLADAKGITLALSSDTPAATTMQGDPDLLFEAIGNLLDNAIKFTPSGGRVEVRTFNRNASIGIAVSDSGPGIPLEDREAVLRRFHRAEASRHTPGSGLGLALVAAIARLHASSSPANCVGG